MTLVRTRTQRPPGGQQKAILAGETACDGVDAKTDDRINLPAYADSREDIANLKSDVAYMRQQVHGLRSKLHGELAVRAKGILLLRESGLPEPPLDAETRERLAELAQLERSIGKAGVLAVRPLMMATGKEIWQLTLLRP